MTTIESQLPTTSPDETSIDNSTKNPPSQKNQLKLAQPRPAWLFFLLMFGSFGIYTSFWLFFRAREFKFILNNSLRPWLWPFVPYFVITELVALPRFVKCLNQVEEKCNLPKWNAWHNIWYLLIIAITIICNLIDKFQVPGWCAFVLLTLWSFLFTVIDRRVTIAKNALTGYEYKKRKHALSISEGLTLFIALPFTIFFNYTLAAPFLNEIKKLSSNSVYTDEKNGFTLPILENRWSIVKNGTLSDGTTILELQGPLQDMHLLVFHHSPDETLDSAAYSRIDEIMTNVNEANCGHSRTLSKNGESVIAKVICTGTFINEKVLKTVTVIETKEGIFELHGHMSTVAKDYEKHKKTFIDMSSGFSPL